MFDTLLGNRFRVLAELGRGAMGAVYRVADTLDGDREMALKRLRLEGGGTPEMRLRFKQEFRAMARLKHPNTIELYGFGQLDEEGHFLTMELVDGHDLGDLARGESRPSLPSVYAWLTQILQALGFIHSRAFVHRDVKAENIRVTPDGRVKLMDFGLMVRVGSYASSGQVAGTPGYMAPEAITGGVVTPATDLYAVGCLAYELVTGRLPFEGRVRDVLRAQIHEQPQPMSGRVPGVPVALERFVARLLAKDPTARYRDAAAAIAELSALSGLEASRENLDQKLSYLSAGALIGREPEVASLEADLEAASQGKGRAVFLGAPAGMGKSRLLRELMLQAQWHECQVLLGHCQGQGHDPLEPLATATLPLLALATTEELDSFRPLLTRLFPARFAQAPGAAPLEPTDLCESLAGWLGAIAARTPLLVAIEDIHLADLPTLDALNDLIPRLDGSRILLIATLRHDETPPGSPVWYALNEGLARYALLSPLDESRVLQLLQAMLGEVTPPEAFVRLLFAATAGNPFYVTEMLRYLMEERVLGVREGKWQFPDDLSGLELPASVEETVRRRMQLLGRRARQVATIAAVMGRHQDRTALLAVSGLEEEELFAALDELLERQFLLPEEDGYSFPHDRVREALYAELPEGARRGLHQRYALHLEATAGAEGALAELAYHFSRGEDRIKAFEYQRRLGDRSRQAAHIPIAVHAWLEAITHLEGIAYPDKEAILGQLRLDVGVFGFDVAPQAAIAALDKAFPYFEAEAGRRGDADAFVTLTQCLAAMASAYGRTGEPAVALALSDLLATIGHAEGSPWGGVSRMAYCTGLMPAGHFDAVIATARQAGASLLGHDLSDYPPLVHASRVLALSAQNAAAYQGERPDAGLRDAALAAAHAMRADNLLNEVHANFALWNAWTGREDEARAIIEQMAETARHCGAPPHPTVLYVRAYLVWQRGEPDEALALVRQALGYPHVDQALVTKRMIEVLQATLLLEQGARDEAELMLWPLETHAREAGLDFVRIQVLLALGRTLLLQGERDNGLMALRIAEAMSAEGPARNPFHHALAQRLLAASESADGELEAARDRLMRALAIATDPAQSNLILEAHLHADLTSIEQALGRPQAAGVSRRTAAALYGRLGYRHLQYALQESTNQTDDSPVPPAQESPRAAGRPPLFLQLYGDGKRFWSPSW